MMKRKTHQLANNRYIQRIRPEEADLDIRSVHVVKRGATDQEPFLVQYPDRMIPIPKRSPASLRCPIRHDPIVTKQELHTKAPLSANMFQPFNWHVTVD